MIAQATVSEVNVQIKEAGMAEDDAWKTIDYNQAGGVTRTTEALEIPTRGALVRTLTVVERSGGNAAAEAMVFIPDVGIHEMKDAAGASKYVLSPAYTVIADEEGEFETPDCELSVTAHALAEAEDAAHQEELKQRREEIVQLRAHITDICSLFSGALGNVLQQIDGEFPPTDEAELPEVFQETPAPVAAEAPAAVCISMPDAVAPQAPLTAVLEVAAAPEAAPADPVPVT
jgi:hypothetical protein